MNLGQRLKKLRLDAGYKQTDLADKLNLTASAIGLYENGRRTPNNDTLERYTQIFNVSYDYLLGQTNSNISNANYTTINVYGRVPAGIPIEAVENIEDTEDISFSAGYSPAKDYIGLIVDGDSMFPKYLKGDVIIIEIIPDCESGKDCVVYVNGYDATLKTVIKNDDGTITLKPINTSYPPTTYGENDEPIKILGVVKEIRRRV